MVHAPADRNVIFGVVPSSCYAFDAGSRIQITQLNFDNGLPTRFLKNCIQKRYRRFYVFEVVKIHR